jgi:hypothetical protein
MRSSEGSTRKQNNREPIKGTWLGGKEKSPPLAGGPGLRAHGGTRKETRGARSSEADSSLAGPDCNIVSATLHCGRVLRLENSPALAGRGRRARRPIAVRARRGARAPRVGATRAQPCACAFASVLFPADGVRQPSVSGGGTAVEPRPRGVVAMRRTIACQLKRFALGGDVEGVDAHAPFPMMAVDGRALRLRRHVQMAGT